MRRSGVLVVWFLLAFGAAAAEPPKSAELERLNSLIEELTALKSQAAAIESRIDTLTRALVEQRGALQARPAAYDALKASAAAESPADAKPPVVRCAALTTEGKRCTRAATEGSKYCKQHQLARQK
ncbi:MAG: hypothetical protein HY821_20885 [Acidobacteria bacterium]|nr:hypothetical protein [Acidobacteriota bacterium]